MAKKKVKKRDFSKAKEKVKKALKISAKALIAIIGIAVTLAFIVVPFLHIKIDAVIAKCIWYPSCVLFVVSAVATVFKKPKTPSKYPIFDFLGNLGLVPIVVIFSSAFLINYYDTAYTWWWAIFVLVALFLPFFVFGMRSFLKKEKEYTEDQIKTSLKVCWKYVGFYWLMDLFYMAIFNYWTADEQSQTLWLTLQFVFGGLAMVYIFYNLARAFLSNAQKHWWGLLQDFLWGIAITVYLIFLIPDSALQTIVMTIIAAIYGGLLTLVGVAWTIKDANDEKKKDLILQHKPIIYAHMMNSFVTLKETPIELLFVDLKKIKSIGATEEYLEEGHSTPEDQTSKRKQTDAESGGIVTLKSIVNTDNSIIIVKKITINDIELTPLNNNVMAKSKAYNLSLHVSNLTDKDQIKLYAEDVLKNPYCFTMLLYIHKDKKGETQYGIMRIEECKAEET